MTEYSDHPSLEQYCFGLETANGFRGQLVEVCCLTDAVIGANVLSEMTRDVVVKTINTLGKTGGQVDSLFLGIFLRDLSSILTKKELAQAAALLWQIVHETAAGHQIEPREV